MSRIEEHGPPPPRRAPRGPVVIDHDDAAGLDPAAAVPVPDVDGAGVLPEGRAMQIATRLAARRRSRLGQFFWLSGGALLSFLVSMAAWAFVSDLMARYPLLGWIATVLIGLFVLAAAGLALREALAYGRLGRLDQVQKAAAAALATADLAAARRVSKQVSGLYAGREEARAARARLAARSEELMDADAVLALTETELMTALDAAARREIELGARTVATVTAMVPLALADVFSALTVNLRMVRRLAEIYGGRAGTFGSLRLMRAVMTHLVATGAVAVGDDAIHTLAGGGLLAKLSRRFGEGVVNGALTARVGLAAMEVCRPLPFRALPRPKVSNLVARGLAGLFPTGKD